MTNRSWNRCLESSLMVILATSLLAGCAGEDDGRPGEDDVRPTGEARGALVVAEAFPASEQSRQQVGVSDWNVHADRLGYWLVGNRADRGEQLRLRVDREPDGMISMIPPDSPEALLAVQSMVRDYGETTFRRPPSPGSDLDAVMAVLGSPSFAEAAQDARGRRQTAAAKIKVKLKCKLLPPWCTLTIEW
jgi:hypothetical protein